jgi:hypothetical protein
MHEPQDVTGARVWPPGGLVERGRDAFADELRQQRGAKAWPRAHSHRYP